MKVGLILYSVRDEMAKDPIATARKVAAMGYKNLEVCNHNAIADQGCGFGVDAESLKATLDAFGSKVISAHIFPIEKCDMQKVIAYEQTLGNTNIVNPMGKFSTYDDLMQQCEIFNRMGKLCHENGTTFLYHNHHQEYKTFGGKTILDIICENTDPDYLSLELDTFWTMRGGHDPVETLKHFGDRVKLVHQKDFAWDSMAPINLVGITPEEIEMQTGDVFGIDGSDDYAKNGGRKSENAGNFIKNLSQEVSNSAFAEVGTGIMKIQDIIDAANEYTSAEYLILEQDYTRMPSQIDSIAKSMESFRKFSGISWDA